MKYPHIVKHNGVWYPAGVEIPEDATPVLVEDVPKPIEEPKEEPRVEPKPEPIKAPVTEKKRGGRKPRNTKK